MKKKILFVSLFLVLVAASACAYFITQDKSVKVESINDKENILKKVDSIFVVNVSGENNYYDKSELNLSDLSLNQKVQSVINYLDIKINTTSVPESRLLTVEELNSIKETYKYLFNEEFNITDNQKVGLYPFITKTGNEYYIDNMGGGLTLNTWYKYNIKMVTTDTEIKLYQKVAFQNVIQKNGVITDFVLSSDRAGSKVVLTLSLDEYSKKTDKNYFKTYAEDHLNKFDTYVYTFKKSNNEFYFYKVEKK